MVTHDAGARNRRLGSSCSWPMAASLTVERPSQEEILDHLKELA